MLNFWILKFWTTLCDSNALFQKSGDGPVQGSTNARDTFSNHIKYDQFKVDILSPLAEL